MTVHCSNCQQAVLPDDTACWHCGAKLVPVKTAAAENTASSMSDRWSLLTGVTLPSAASPTAVYGALTLALMLVAWLTLRQLGQPPLLQLASGDAVPHDWVSVLVGDYDYTLDLPHAWVRADALQSAEQAQLEAFLAEQADLSATLLPFADAVDDLVPRYAAWEMVDGERPSFVMIWHSQQLSQRPANDLLALAEQGDVAGEYELFRQERVDNFNKSHLAFGVKIDNEWRCLHQLIQRPAQGLWVIACAPHHRFVAERPRLDQVMESVEYLRRGE